MPFYRSSFLQRDLFGRLKREQDEEFQKLRDRPFAQSVRSLSNLKGNVGRHETNNRSDVARIETLMAREDKYDISRTDGPTGIFSVGLENAIKDYQEDKGLKRDGLITPRGETIASMIKIKTLDSDGGEGDEGDDETPEGPPEPPPEAPPEDTPEEPPEDPEDPDNDCSDIEGELADAEARLDSVQQALDAVVSEKEALENSIAEAISLLENKQAQADNIQSQIDELQTLQEKENKDKFIYRKGGEWFGRATGARGKRIGSEIGGAIFDDIGDAIESGVDFLTGQKTDAQIQQEISALSNQLSTIQADIATIQEEIAGPQAQIAELEASIADSQSEVDAAQAEVSSLQSALEACQSSGDDQK